MNTLAHYNQTAENQRKKHSKQHKCILINYIQGDNSLNHWFFIRITEATRQWNSKIKVLKGKKSEPRILYLMETLFKNESEGWQGGAVG